MKTFTELTPQEIHCWEMQTDEAGNTVGVCLLADEHEGEHEFTPSEDVVVEFIS